MQSLTLQIPSPARVLAVATMVGQVLNDLAARDPETLSTAEADCLACLIDCRDDLEDIATKARLEMGALTVEAVRLGVMG